MYPSAQSAIKVHFTITTVQRSDWTFLILISESRSDSVVSSETRGREDRNMLNEGTMNEISVLQREVPCLFTLPSSVTVDGSPSSHVPLLWLLLIRLDVDLARDQASRTFF